MSPLARVHHGCCCQFEAREDDEEVGAFVHHRHLEIGICAGHCACSRDGPIEQKERQMDDRNKICESLNAGASLSWNCLVF
jgi:hypothetical protein